MTKSVFSDEYKLFRLLLKEERIKAGIKQKELSERLGMPNSFVCKYEQGERRLDVIEFLRIAREIGFNPHDIIEKLDVD